MQHNSWIIDATRALPQRSTAGQSRCVWTVWGLWLESAATVPPCWSSSITNRVWDAPPAPLSIPAPTLSLSLIWVCSSLMSQSQDQSIIYLLLVSLWWKALAKEIVQQQRCSWEVYRRVTANFLSIKNSFYYFHIIIYLFIIFDSIFESSELPQKLSCTLLSPFPVRFYLTHVTTDTVFKWKWQWVPLTWNNGGNTSWW